jgi:hypothetical protein
MRAEEVTEALGIKPLFGWSAGDQRSTPKGQPLEGTYPTTYWCSQSTKGVGFDLEERLSMHLSEIEPHRDFLARFKSTGGSIEYYIGWSTYGMNTGAIFDAELLNRLVALGIDLSLDIYGMAETSKESETDSSGGATSPPS